MNREGQAGIGCSGHIEVPDSIRVEIANGKELGPLLGDMHARDIRNNEGAWGYLRTVGSLDLIRL